MKPCDSHIKALRKIASKLRWGLTMDESTLILTEENLEKLEEAELLLAKVIRKLKEIE